MMQVSTLLADLEPLKERATAEQVTDLEEIRQSISSCLDRCLSVEHQLIRWYESYQSHEPFALFTLLPLDWATRAQDVPFHESIRFTSSTKAQVLVMYWSGEVLLHQGIWDIEKLLRNLAGLDQQLGSPHEWCEDKAAPLPEETLFFADIMEKHERALRDAAAIAEQFANKVCQAVLGCQLYDQDRDLLRDHFVQMASKCRSNPCRRLTQAVKLTWASGTPIPGSNLFPGRWSRSQVSVVPVDFPRLSQEGIRRGRAAE